MILGALFDAGLDFDAWKRGMAGLKLPALELRIEKVNKQGIAATRLVSRFPEEHAHRGLSEVRALLRGGGLPSRVMERAEAVFMRLADAEASVHGVPVEQVQFHEVGALDAVMDIAGACLGFEMLGIEGFLTTPFTFGTGTVRTAHGTLSVPVPATVALSRGFPSRRTAIEGELCTPTGMAIVTAFAKPVPAGWTGRTERIGYGAGTRDLQGIANVLRICIMAGESSENGMPDSGGDGVGLFQIECNLDNMAPELIGYAMERLFAAGCKDAWQEPIHMKKNRSAVKLCALAEAGHLDAALQVLAAETATGGMRWFPVRRLVAAKSAAVVATSYGAVAMKRVEFPGRSEPRLTPEFESCRALALASGVPLQAVYLAAQRAAAAMDPAAVSGAGSAGGAPARNDGAAIA